MEAGRRWADDGITANALMPGGIRTALQRHQEGAAMSPEVREIFDSYPWRTARQGAATSVLLAASPLVEGVTGRYFENCNEALPLDPALAGPLRRSPRGWRRTPWTRTRGASVGGLARTLGD